ncbi:hypothetical protein DRQ53_10275 [bacterium]|nr:MAG: hypothetical protein DRQ32_02955 [bacterium]RKZ14948.1 MAG: hypothetical protein DRQ53_10275 [bacterium]
MKTVKASDWKRSPMSELHTTVRLDRAFPDDDMAIIRSGLCPEQMEDKWFVYWDKDVLYFHRSWTGVCIYAVRFHVDSHGYRMIESEVNRDPDQYSQTNDEFDARLISYLIDVLLLQHEASYPDEDDFVPRDPLAMWSLVGRASVNEHPGSSN